MESTRGKQLVVIADSAADAIERAVSAGFPHVGAPPYRVDERELRPFVGAFQLIPPPVAPAPGASLPASPSAAVRADGRSTTAARTGGGAASTA